MKVHWIPIASAYLFAIVVAATTVATPVLRELSWDATFKVFLYVPGCIGVALTLLKPRGHANRGMNEDEMAAMNAAGTKPEVRQNNVDSRRDRLLEWGINFFSGWITAFFLVVVPVHLYFK